MISDNESNEFNDSTYSQQIEKAVEIVSYSGLYRIKLPYSAP